MEQQSLIRRRRATTRSVRVALGVALAFTVVGCGRDADRAGEIDRTTTTTQVTTTTAAVVTTAPSTTTAPAPTTVPSPPATALPADQAAALDQELASIGSSLDAADAANRQADPGLARQQEGTAP